MLSKAEQLVADMVAKGLSNKEVGVELFITEKTVKFHLTNIFKKENVSSRAELILKYARSSPDRPVHVEPRPIVQKTHVSQARVKYLQDRVARLQDKLAEANDILDDITRHAVEVASPDADGEPACLPAGLSGIA